MDIIDPALDLLEFIVFLAGICSICFTVIIPVTKEINEIAYVQRTDKLTVNATVTENTVTGATMSADEVALMVSSQSNYLVSPLVLPKIEDLDVYDKYRDQSLNLTKDEQAIYFVVNGEKINITGLSQDTASAVYDKIEEWCLKTGHDIDTTKFTVKVSMGEQSTFKDNVYQLYYMHEYIGDDYTARADWVACN